MFTRMTVGGTHFSPAVYTCYSAAVLEGVEGLPFSISVGTSSAGRARTHSTSHHSILLEQTPCQRARAGGDARSSCSTSLGRGRSMALSGGLTFAVIRSLQDRPLEAKRLTTILEAQDERVPRETPRHPVRSLQGALEESLVENADPRKARWPAMPSAVVDSATRRRLLLQHLDSDAAYTTPWRQRPEERHHPLTKLVAQISYGIHLLHKGMVSSDAEVIRILQTYVGEVDNFLEQTTEDFDLALGDIEERIKCLRLPLEHDEIFDSMLEDRVFRKQIVDGNEKIEHIINRTETAMNDALDDVQAGLEATKELAKYLVRLDRKWVLRTEEQDDVYAAMSGNTEGWFRCFFSLQTKGQNLSMLTIQLGTVVAELQRRAGVASRKNIVRSTPR